MCLNFQDTKAGKYWKKPPKGPKNLKKDPKQTQKRPKKAQKKTQNVYAHSPKSWGASAPSTPPKMTPLARSKGESWICLHFGSFSCNLVIKNMVALKRQICHLYQKVPQVLRYFLAQVVTLAFQRNRVIFRLFYFLLLFYVLKQRSKRPFWKKPLFQNLPYFRSEIFFSKTLLGQMYIYMQVTFGIQVI